MSGADTSQGEGWWQADDGKWYPPQQDTRMAAPAPQPTGGGQVQLPSNVTSASPGIRLGSYLLEIVLFIFTLGIGWLIWAATIGGTGQTPAKRLLNLRVIGCDTTSRWRPLSLPGCFPDIQRGE